MPRKAASKATGLDEVRFLNLKNAIVAGFQFVNIAANVDQNGDGAVSASEGFNAAAASFAPVLTVINGKGSFKDWDLCSFAQKTEIAAACADAIEVKSEVANRVIDAVIISLVELEKSIRRVYDAVKQAA